MLQALDGFSLALPQGKSRRSNKVVLWSRGEEMVERCPGEARELIEPHQVLGHAKFQIREFELWQKREDATTASEGTALNRAR
jgi:hypothetical protein